MGVVLFKFLLVALLAVQVQAQEGAFNSACLHGLNDAASPATLGNCESPDLLNTESNLDGTAILKRKGYSVSSNLAITTSSVSGSHSFIDSGGNRQDIVCQDRNCAKSTNGNAFVVFLTTAGSSGPVPTRWSFVDTGGILYGANNKRDAIMRYDGTVLSYPTGMPTGSILELSQDRLIVGDISGLPNRVHRSSAGAYEQFTPGVNGEDSFFDDIGAAGDRIRGIKCISGNCFYFKTASITLCEESDQYATECSVISPTIGTTDAAAIVAAGSTLYFRAQDKNFWELSSSGLRQISKKIPNLVKSQLGGLTGGENTNTQTTQADWAAGSQRPSGSWDYGTTNGSIFPSSVTLVDTSSSNFAAGTLSGLTTSYIGNSIQLSSAAFLIRNGDFATADTTDWTCSAAGAGSACGYNGAGAGYVYAGINGGTPSSAIKILDQNDNVLYTDGGIGQATCNTGTLDLYALGLSTRTLKLGFFGNGNGAAASLVSSTFTAISSITFSCTYINSGGGSFGTVGYSPGPDNVKINRYFALQQSSVTPALFTSRIFDATVTTTIGGPFLPSTSTPIGTNLAYSVRSSTSPNNDLWGAWSSISSGTRITQTSHYWQYVSTFTSSVGTSTPRIDAINLPLATTGQFVTQCIQPNQSISVWGTLSCAQTLAGAGSLVYYTTSALTCGALPTGDPSTWQTSMANNATVTIATNTAVKIGFRSLLGSATDQAQVDSCVLSWNEGTAIQPSWATYDSVKNAVYWTSTVSGSSVTNRLLKFDRNLEYWYPFDISAQAPRMINNTLYFGGASSGTWNIYGSVDSDDGQAINAYWKSKDIGSDSPFAQKSFKSLSILSRNNVTGSMTGTWTLSNAQTQSYTISLATGSGISYARSNYLLPLTSPQEFINVKVGNNSSTPFEVLGIGLTWAVLPWKVSGP